MKASELREMIAKIVEQEVRRVVPEVLGEMYVRRLVEEQVGARRAPSVAPVAQAAPARPAPKKQLSSLIESMRGELEETGESAFARGEPAAAFGDSAHLFEGLAPMGDPNSTTPMSESEARFGPGGVPLEMLGVRQNLGDVAGIVEKRREVSSAEAAAFETQRLMMQRKQLEGIKVG